MNQYEIFALNAGFYLCRYLKHMFEREHLDDIGSADPIPAVKSTGCIHNQAYGIASAESRKGFWWAKDFTPVKSRDVD